MAKTNNKHSGAQHRTPVYRRPWVIIALILIFIAAVVTIMIALNSKPDTTSSQETPAKTATDDTSSSEQQPNTDKNESGKSNNEPEDKVVRYEGENPNQLETLTGSILYASNDGNLLTIAATVDQFLSEPGTCTLTLTGDQTGKTYTQTVDLVAEVATSVCEIFEIPTSELVSDHYQIKIQLSGNQKTGLITGETSL